MEENDEKDVIDAEVIDKGGQQSSDSQPSAPLIDEEDKAWSLVAYLTLIGWLIAFIGTSNKNSKSEFLKFHLNQGLVINLFSLLAYIPVIGWLWGLFIIACQILGIIYSANGEMKKVPLFGNLKILN